MRWLWLVIVAACGGAGGAGGADAAIDAEQADARPPPDPHACADLYDPAELPTFEIDIAASEWAALMDEFAHPAEREAAGLPLKPYHPVMFRTGVEVVGDAMIRLKGNPWFSWVPPKMQFVVSFNEVNRDGRFHGLRKLAFDAPWYDPSLLHERLADSVLRDQGIPAPCANHARLVINGVYYGLYTNLEHIDKEYLERNFGDAGSQGNLYKYGWELKTNEDVADVTRRDLFWSTYDPAALAAFVDLEQSVAEWAAEAVLPQGDGYWCCAHNFYLYDHPSRGFLFLPSDMDYTLDGSPNFLFIPPDADPLSWVRDITQKPPHFASVMADPFWRGRFVAGVAAARAGYDPPVLQARVDAWSAQIASAMAEDPNLPYTVADHQAAVVHLRDFPPARAAFLDSWLACFEGLGGTDVDADGVAFCNDCNDLAPGVHPGAAEMCNGIDDDCDGVVDDPALCPDCNPLDLGVAHFSFCTLPRDWFAAAANCSSLGGALAAPVDQSEQDFLVASGAGWSPDNWWLGVNDLTSEGTWTAIDGAPLVYTWWGPGRPNGLTDQNCVVLDATMAGAWNDKSCAEIHPSVCRLP